MVEFASTQILEDTTATSSESTCLHPHALHRWYVCTACVEVFVCIICCFTRNRKLKNVDSQLVINTCRLAATRQLTAVTGALEVQGIKGVWQWMGIYPTTASALNASTSWICELCKEIPKTWPQWYGHEPVKNHFLLWKCECQTFPKTSLSHWLPSGLNTASLALKSTHTTWNSLFVVFFYVCLIVNYFFIICDL